MGMLIEIAAANLAFKTVSTLLKNGKQLYEVGVQVSDYLSATQKVKEKAGNSASKGTALQAFQYNETLRIQRSQLEFHLKKSRLNGWSDFVKFEAEWHRNRKEEEKAKARKKAAKQKAIQENIDMGIKIGCILLIIMGALFGVAVYLRN
tara:strand:- start:193 stop:639 length:447 start_codon:yes stop_codon:yes gene_type:complete